MNDLDFKIKYIKYKLKYLQLKQNKQIGGSGLDLPIFGSDNSNTQQTPPPNLPNTPTFEENTPTFEENTPTFEENTLTEPASGLAPTEPASGLTPTEPASGLTPTEPASGLAPTDTPNAQETQGYPPSPVTPIVPKYKPIDNLRNLLEKIFKDNGLDETKFINLMDNINNDKKLSKIGYDKCKTLQYIRDTYADNIEIRHTLNIYIKDINEFYDNLMDDPNTYFNEGQFIKYIKDGLAEETLYKTRAEKMQQIIRVAISDFLGSDIETVDMYYDIEKLFTRQEDYELDRFIIINILSNVLVTKIKLEHPDYEINNLVKKIDIINDLGDTDYTGGQDIILGTAKDIACRLAEEEALAEDSPPNCFSCCSSWCKKNCTIQGGIDSFGEGNILHEISGEGDLTGPEKLNLEKIKYEPKEIIRLDKLHDFAGATRTVDKFQERAAVYLDGEPVKEKDYVEEALVHAAKNSTQILFTLEDFSFPNAPVENQGLFRNDNGAPSLNKKKYSYINASLESSGVNNMSKPFSVDGFEKINDDDEADNCVSILTEFYNKVYGDNISLIFSFEKEGKYWIFSVKKKGEAQEPIKLKLKYGIGHVYSLSNEIYKFLNNRTGEFKIFEDIYESLTEQRLKKIFINALFGLKYVGDWIQSIIHFGREIIEDIYSYYITHDYLNFVNTYCHFYKHKFKEQNINNILILNIKSISDPCLKRIPKFKDKLKYTSFIIIADIETIRIKCEFKKACYYILWNTHIDETGALSSTLPKNKSIIEDILNKLFEDVPNNASDAYEFFNTNYTTLFDTNGINLTEEYNIETINGINSIDIKQESFFDVYVKKKIYAIKIDKIRDALLPDIFSDCTAYTKSFSDSNEDELDIFIPILNMFKVQPSQHNLLDIYSKIISIYKPLSILIDTYLVSTSLENTRDDYTQYLLDLITLGTAKITEITEMEPTPKFYLRRWYYLLKYATEIQTEDYDNQHTEQDNMSYKDAIEQYEFDKERIARVLENVAQPTTHDELRWEELRAKTKDKSDKKSFERLTKQLNREMLLFNTVSPRDKGGGERQSGRSVIESELEIINDGLEELKKEFEKEKEEALSKYFNQAFNSITKDSKKEYFKSILNEVDPMATTIDTKIGTKLGEESATKLFHYFNYDDSFKMNISIFTGHMSIDEELILNKFMEAISKFVSPKQRGQTNINNYNGFHRVYHAITLNLIYIHFDRFNNDEDLYNEPNIDIIVNDVKTNFETYYNKIYEYKDITSPLSIGIYNVFRDSSLEWVQNSETESKTTEFMSLMEDHQEKIGIIEKLQQIIGLRE